MPNLSDAQLEILSQHYSETFELLKHDVAKRDRLFLYILTVSFVMLLYMSAPTAMSERLNTFLNSKTGGTAATPLIDVSFIGVILLLGLLTLSHTYFQTSLHVERQYDYIYQLETQLSEHFGNQAFIREGKHYRSHRRKFSQWTKIIFWILFPLLFILFNAVWLFFLFTVSRAPAIYKLIDILITTSTLVSLGFYMLALIRKI